MAELRGGRDEPDDDDSPVRRTPVDAGDGAGEIKPPREPNSRAEYAVIARRQSELINTGQADADQEDAEQEDTDQEDTDQAPDPSDADVLERFEPSRVGLPEISREDAVEYIEEHYTERPWLANARDCSPDVQRVFAALDQGGGHAHIRHDSWVTEEMNECRVRYLEDPAQLDPAKREAHIDAFKAGDKHQCGALATRITDATVFAAGIARVSEDPAVRAALDSTELFPVPVRLRISDVLGDDGHKFCTGWQLEPVDGDMAKAVANRKAWAKGDHSVPEPRSRVVDTFEGGTITFTFRPSVLGGHQFNTVLVNPPEK